MPRRGRTRYRHWATNLEDLFVMGRRNFHGAVKTLADAVEADYLVLVVCEACLRRRQMHPYILTSKSRRLHAATFDVSHEGFRCLGCKQIVTVRFVCTYRRPGEF